MEREPRARACRQSLPAGRDKVIDSTLETPERKRKAALAAP